ncbi:hypothetical protein Pst134EA_031504 [Puccinia striiformis f. sp. tritici]|uniref:uncharacterized protein n=1 Tax=Puccinia striiformis f. sp. tritici TaxID=168172 RepID=UPI002007A0C4|nr:uncharacterized protein Pst134EA_031504 [Puccinia striiformis f. sp. tritici]KAH9445279.1 hypothetical protein Pst134EA_031504 [Puccinia striiformis f. sp. tritici]
MNPQALARPHAYASTAADVKPATPGRADDDMRPLGLLYPNREDHIHLASKRKSVDPSPPDPVQQRKERLKQKITQIEHDIKTSEIIHQAQLDRIQSA